MTIFPTPPTYLAAQFLQAFLNLMPRGRAWAKYVGSNMSTALATLMPTYELSSLAATNLLYDIFPANTLALIPEWQKSLGLPDPCSGDVSTTDQQRAQIVARFIAAGGQSIPFIIAYALNLGFVITITENDLGFLMGINALGDGAFGSDTDIFIWTVNAPLYGLHFFEMGVNVMNDFLGYFDENTVLECEIRALAPAQTFVNFLYT